MTGAARKALDQALALPEEDRARIATELIASLDGPPDEDWEASWLAELDRRVEEARRTDETGEDWAAVRADLLATLSHPR